MVATRGRAAGPPPGGLPRPLVGGVCDATTRNASLCSTWSLQRSYFDRRPQQFTRGCYRGSRSGCCALAGHGLVLFDELRDKHGC